MDNRNYQTEAEVENLRDLLIELLFGKGTEELNLETTPQPNNEIEGKSKASQLDRFLSNRGQHSQNKTEAKSPNSERDLGALSSLIVSPDTSKYDKQLKNLKQQVSSLEHKTLDRSELKAVLIPLIAEIVNRQIAESNSDLLQAIAPILDRAIQERTQLDPEQLIPVMASVIAKAIQAQDRRDRQAMVDALSPIIDEVTQQRIETTKKSLNLSLETILNGVISRYIQNSPAEIAQAIAPEIASAIQEQNRLNKQATINALVPIIYDVIQKSNQQDREAMSTAIAPAISVAIAKTISTSPTEIAKAIAPEISLAIQEQTKRDRRAMVEALTPLIDDVIKLRIQQDKGEISTAVSPAIITAISQIIGNSPTEFSRIIAPEISQAIREQTRLDRPSIIAALTPLIDELIAAKIRQDKAAMGGAIAPVIPAAISQAIAQYPTEIAKAIAPEIGKAIHEQNCLDKEAMVQALSAVIPLVIERNIQTEPQSILAILEPVINSIISHYIETSKSEIFEAIAPQLIDTIKEQTHIDRQEMVKELSPVVDRMIQIRTEEDKTSMSAAIAPVLSPAISKRIQEVPEEVAMAIAPEIATAIKEQIKLKEEAMADALYPVIGNTIAKYIAETLRDINQKIEHTLSLEGIKRKIRARIKGVSEAELLLSEETDFTVRAIFLIQKDTGLVISDIQPSGDHKLESDMIGGMLTAIRTFVGEYIAQAGNTSEIDEINYGNSQIHLEVAGYCYLAVAIDGEPSKNYRLKMRQTFSKIVRDYSKPIQSYEGDPDTIPQPVNQLLEELIRTDSKVTRQRPPALLIIGVALASLIAGSWGMHQYRDSRDRRLTADVANALESTPELSIYRLTAKAHRGTLTLAGKVPNDYLRQKAEEIATSVVPKLALENKIDAVEVPPDPVQTAKQVEAIAATLNQIDGISISATYAAGKVTVTGTVVQNSQAQTITRSFEQISGVKSLTNTVELQPLKIDTRIYFNVNSAQLKPEDIDVKILPVKRFLTQHPQTHLRIVGHVDGSSDAEKTPQLALQRAEIVKNALETQGIDPQRLDAIAKSHPPLDVGFDGPLWLKRAVIFYPVTAASRR